MQLDNQAIENAHRENPEGFTSAAQEMMAFGKSDNFEKFVKDANASSASRVLEKSFDDPGSGYLELFKSYGAPEYLEKYIDNLMAEKSASDARSFQKMQDDTQYSRAFKDIEKAGYNPWLLLQGGVATAGSGNYSAASYSKNSASEAIRSRKNQAEIAEQNNKTKLLVGFVAAAALIAKALI